MIIDSSNCFCVQQFEFKKTLIPVSKEEAMELAKKLSKYSITLVHYENTLSQREIKP